jgi:hypothetical protein
MKPRVKIFWQKDDWFTFRAEVSPGAFLIQERLNASTRITRINANEYQDWMSAADFRVFLVVIRGHSRNSRRDV